MINLLPAEDKKKILGEYRLRLAVISTFAVGALIFSSLVLLAPSYLFAVSKYNTAEGRLTVLEKKKSLSGQEVDANKQVVAVNKNIELFLKPSTATPSSLIAKILSHKEQAIKITGFTYDASANQERIVVTGVARDRESLARFVDVMKKDETFKSVDVPISSYVKSADIDFSAVILVKKTK